MLRMFQFNYVESFLLIETHNLLKVLKSAMIDLFLAALCRLVSEKRLHAATQSC